VAQLDAHHDLRDAVDDAEQPEQQREGYRAHAGAGEQHHAEQDGHQSAQDEQRPGARGLSGLERGEDLEEAADERPDPDDQHQHQRGGTGPHQGDHPGSRVDHRQQQVANHRPGGATAERAHGLQDRVDERVDREHVHQGQDRHAGPGQRDDPDDNGQDADQDQ
jgi:hypothetical protein